MNDFIISSANLSSITLKHHQGLIRAIAFSPDKQWLATGSEDHTVMLWDLNDLTAEPTREIVPFQTFDHTDTVHSLAFSPNGKWLAAGNTDHIIQLFNMDDLASHPITLYGHEERIRALVFSSDSRLLLSGGEDNTVRLWTFLDELIKTGCNAVWRNLTWDEWQTYFPLQAYHQTCSNLPRHPSIPQGE